MKADELIEQANDAERSVLGCILTFEGALDELAFLEPRHFGREAHKKVYCAMLALAGRNEPVDRVTVKGELTAQGTLAEAGGDDFIDLLDKLVPVATNAVWYARRVVDAALFRGVRQASATSAQEALTQVGTATELLDRAEERLSSLRNGADSARAAVSMREVMRQTMKSIESASARGTQVTGLASGLADLDMDTTGWQPGELIILAARPSVGKTAAALNWGLHAALLQNVTIAIFEMEMPRTDLTKRMLASEGRVSLQRIRTGQLLDSDWSKLATASATIGGASIEIDDTPAISVMELRSKARRIARRAPTDKPLGWIVVDYLQLMHGNAAIENREQQVSDIALGLKHLAGELRVPVIALSQLNRNVEHRSDGLPRLSDLRESGALEQHADMVIFAHRRWVLDKKADPKLAQFIIAKQRNGPIGTVEAEFHGEHVLFVDRDGDREHRHEARNG